MINIDAYLREFILNNSTTLMIIYVFLKRLAKLTPWTIDDNILEAIGGAFSILKNKKEIKK